MTRAQRSRLRAIILALTLAASTGVATAQQAPLISQPFSMTTTGSGPIIPLDGQSSCAISVYNAGVGLTLVPQASSDNGVTWTTVSAIGSGSISTFGNYVGSVAGTGLTSFRFLITALSSGSVSGNEVCSGAIGSETVSGGTVTAIQPTASLLNATVVFPSAQSVNATLQAGSAVIGNVNQTTGTAGYSYLLDSAGTNKLAINSNGSINTTLYNAGGFAIQTLADGTLRVAQGKTAYTLTSASATTCTNLQATAGTLVGIINVGSATSIFPAFYDDAGATCATGARRYGNFTSLTLQAGQAIALNLPLTAGVAYKLSGALSDNLIVVTN